MNFNKVSVTNGVEILVGLTDMHTLTPIKLTASLGGDSLIKAGSPIAEDGTIANTADAVGILLYDVETAENPNGTIIQSGPIDAAKAQDHCGLTYTEAALGALDNIQFRTNIGVNE